MHKGLEFSPLPLEVENPIGNNSLTEIFDCVEGSSPFDEGPESDSSQNPSCYEAWEDFQSLSPFGADWEMEQEFFKSDVIDFECKKQGPTLAELNNQRSMSPLVNPEMERLHRIATRSESEETSSTNSSHHALQYNVNERELKTENQRTAMSSNGGKVNLDDLSSNRSLTEERRGLKSACEFESRASMAGFPTCTESKDATIELRKNVDLMKRIALLEAKSNGKTLIANAQNVQGKTSNLLSYLPREISASEHCTSARNISSDDELPVIREESEDEDMDSDEDFEENICNKESVSPAKHRKGRRGDVEDMSPNPRRLLEIGRELNRLTKVITELKPIHSLPLSARNKSKKEKNKLASRACRLKKKAQHESNKLKLHGLELEQQRLVLLIEKVKAEIIHDTEGYTVTGELSNKVENIIHSTVGKQVVAGHLTNFVESVLKAAANATPGFQGVDVQLNI